MQPYANPYLAGVGLGLVLLAAFVLAGQGLGASGAFAEAASATVHAVDPKAAANPWFQSYLSSGTPWTAWIVLELFGVIIGGALSAILNGRFRVQVARGPGISPTPRLLTAALGGVAMGVGAVLARGCTSGQALTGGALLSVGSWAFMIAVFVGGYAAAPLMRKLWS